MENIKVLLGSSEGEITEKKSRFIAHAYEIHSEAEALNYIESIRKQYWDARHNCFAFVLGRRNEVQRFSDDKEPQGTAGKPILDTITGKNLHNTLIVVTRYFGGTLLGTGGLVRAYSDSSSNAIKTAEAAGQISEIYEGSLATVSCDYGLLGKFQYLFGQMDIHIEDIMYGSNVTFKLIAESDKLKSLKEKITEASSGSSKLIPGETVSFALNNNSVLFYNL